MQLMLMIFAASLSLVGLIVWIWHFKYGWRKKDIDQTPLVLATIAGNASVFLISSTIFLLGIVLFWFQDQYVAYWVLLASVIIGLTQTRSIDERQVIKRIIRIYENEKHLSPERADDEIMQDTAKKFLKSLDASDGEVQEVLNSIRGKKIDKAIEELLLCSAIRSGDSDRLFPNSLMKGAEIQEKREEFILKKLAEIK